jgi:hypothetical protein
MPRRNQARCEDDDPGWLVEAAKQQRPDLPWIAEAFSSCTRVLRRHYGHDECLYLIDPSRPNEPESAWQFMENVVLDAEKVAECIVVDVLTDHRIGAVELLR